MDLQTQNTPNARAARVSTSILEEYRQRLLEHPGTRFELIDAKIFEMSGSKYNRFRIAYIWSVMLRELEEIGPFTSFNSEAGVALEAEEFYAFPDASVIRGAPEILNFGGKDWLTNPALVSEVLSPSTQKKDRSHKWAAYRQIPSLENYVLIASEAPRVEVFYRAPGAEDWQTETFEGQNRAFSVLGGAAEFRLADLYAGIDFSAVCDK